MSNNGITEFLNELNETDALIALKDAQSQKSILLIIIENTPSPIKASIENFLDKRVLLKIENSEIQISSEKLLTIKFITGTEVFFIKTNIKSYLNRYYFDMSAKVIQLKRRRNPRFLIPKKWNQDAGLIPTNNQLDYLKCSVIDISVTGIRLEILYAKPQLNAEDIIKIKFQVYKRAEVVTPAIVRFVLARPNANMIVGLEFVQISDVQQERVNSLVQDISVFIQTTKI